MLVEGCEIQERSCLSRCDVQAAQTKRHTDLRPKGVSVWSSTHSNEPLSGSEESDDFKMSRLRNVAALRTMWYPVAMMKCGRPRLSASPEMAKRRMFDVSDKARSRPNSFTE